MLAHSSGMPGSVRLGDSLLLTEYSKTLLNGVYVLAGIEISDDLLLFSVLGKKKPKPQDVSTNIRFADVKDVSQMEITP